MGLIQKIFKAIMPAATLANMEAESRKWNVKCKTCGTERNIWEMGGIRYSATGSKTTVVRCEPCDTYRSHSVTYSE